jgi:tRNA U34 5-carboxymethylaminomethyl modifying GTPase MnmE/TrmE
MEKAHKKGTATFEKLNYSEQAKSISAQILNLESAIKAHIRYAEKEDKDNPKNDLIKSIKNLLDRINEI